MHPDCHYGDHHWRDGICTFCGKQLRCSCGRFIRYEDLSAHINSGECPSIPPEPVALSEGEG